MVTDFRINTKGELEGKVIPPAKWEEMYTKDEVVAILKEIKDEASNIHSTIWNCDSFIEGVTAYNKLIQEKIDKIREMIEDGNDY